MANKIVFLALLLSISLNAFCGAVDVKRLHKAKWVEVSSDNFTVITDAKEKDAYTMAVELEKFRYFMAFLLKYKQHELSIKIPVILARNKTTFSALGIPSRYAGLFVRRGREYAIFSNSDGFYSVSRSSHGRQVVLHELTHLLMNNISIGLADPPWYAEGTAEYFGTYVEKKGKIILGDIFLLKNRFDFLLRPAGGYESVDTESLFKTEEFRPSSNTSWAESIETGKFYARSLAVVHYLNADPERRRNMLLYLFLINKGHSVDASFGEAFQMSFKEMDNAVNRYIFSGHVYARTFNVGSGGIEYPEFHFSTRNLGQKEAMSYIVPRVAMIGGGLLKDGDVETMYQDIEKLYPDFFAPSL
jgi:hypothetical protein